MDTLHSIHKWHWSLALLLALGVALLLQPVPARAETITVTNTLDDGAGSLRQAITDALPGGLIVFHPDLAGQTITLTSQLEIAKALTIDGTGRTVTLSGNHATRLLYIQAAGAVTISHLSLISGTVTGNGGGIYNAGTLRVTYCTFSGNAATAGGGLYNAGGTAMVASSTLVGNAATNYGGGFYTSGGTVTVIDSTLVNNQVTQSNYCGGGYGGGGLYNNAGTLTVQNSTLADNVASTNCGGGLYNAGTTTVQASTLSGNSADYGGGIWNASGSLNLRQTIVANSSAGHDCNTAGGTVFSVASLFEATGNDACGSSIHYGSILGVDPLLGALLDNGGATPTFALLPNSPAIDTAGGWTCLAADQRGEPRADLVCDIGAYELQHADSDTVVKTGMTTGAQASFGPTFIAVTVTGGDAGTITATKHLTTPGGIYDTGEITATWYLTASNSPFIVTLALCYTEDEIIGLNRESLHAFRWDGMQWTTPISTSLTVDEDANCVILTGIEDFSAWTLKDVSVGAAKPTAARVVGLAVQGFAPFLVGLSFLGGAMVLRRKQRR